MTASEGERWVVAVDGGGTKIAIAAQLWSEHAPAPESLAAARLWTFAHCGSAHPSTWNEAQQHLTEALDVVCRALKLSEARSPVRHVLFALAGAGRAGDRSRVLDWARTLEAPFTCASIDCVSDIEPLIDFCHGRRFGDTGVTERKSQQLRAAAGQTASVAVILGTGSMVATRDRNGRMVRAGGWGPHLGDECSGGALGVVALQSVVAWLDAGSQTHAASPLVAAVLLALPNRDEWMSGLSEDAPRKECQLPATIEIDRDKLASVIIDTAAHRSSAAALARAVLELALEKEDAEARTLIDRQLVHLVWQIEQVARRAELDPARFELVFSGGLGEHWPALRQAIVDACRARGLVPQNLVVAQPLLAALRLAFHGALKG